MYFKVRSGPTTITTSKNTPLHVDLYSPNVSTLWPFTFTATARGSHTNNLFYLTYAFIPLLLFYLHSSHIPHSHTHSIYNTIQSFPFKDTTPHLFQQPPLPNRPPISYINRTAIPIPVINNDFVKQNVVSISKIPTNCKLKRIPTFNYQELNSDFIWHYTLCWKTTEERY